jgi:hypothetical protein
MANDDRETVRPPPGARAPSSNPPYDEQLFIVHLLYPHNLALARHLASHIRKRSEDTVRLEDKKRKNEAFGGLKPDTTEFGKLPDTIRGVIVHAVIVGVDEFCDLDEIFDEVHRYYAEDTPIIVHHDGPTLLDEAVYIEYGAIGAFAGYNFSQIDPLLDAAARNQVKPSMEANLESD